ncbi:hypothetical protein E4U42_007527 [Claviceps africana]|uniref:Uncharacterized protein n=1 Tax=Claviceps africana TaxID=83212 RepID=A0A8K0NF32_9HYPO|nr:hypothetical protein E4U42_007527 [Claviceps africana]
MAPTSSKANYKTYEAQARMVRAMVAAHPEVKWNYKAIAACYGSDMSEHALNHRFRKIRAQSLIIKLGREVGFDMRHLCVDENKLPSTKEAVDQKNIAKYFGQSTADGIQFQFRAYKKDAETLRAVHSAGGDVANCLPLSTLPATPSKPTPSRPTSTSTTNTPVSRLRGAANTGSAARKRPRIKRSSSDEERDEDDEDDLGDDMMDDENDEQDPSDQPDDWSDRDTATPSRKSPTKHRNPRGTAKARATTPRRHAAARATSTMAQLGRQDNPGYDDGEDLISAVGPPTQTTSASTTSTTPVRPYKSIFGDPQPVPEAPASRAHSGLTPFSLDPFMETTMQVGSFDDEYGDGEI